MTAEELRAWYEALTTEGKRVATQEAAEAIFHDERVGDEMDVVRVRGLVRERTERRLRAVAGIRDRGNDDRG